MVEPEPEAEPEIAQPAPQDAPEERPAAAAVAAQVQQPDPEPSLFNGFDAQTAAAQDQMEDIFGAEDDGAAADDGLPPPAYQPAPEPQAPVASVAAPHEEEDERETFVAPRANIGEPSPDAMARLQAAVGRSPRAAASEPPRDSQPQGGAEKSRFGINSLINRMTGSGGGGGDNGQPAARPARQQPPVQSRQAPAALPEDEEDQIEIPAFLRRQAN